MRKIIALLVLSVVICGTMTVVAAQERTEGPQAPQPEESVFHVIARWANFIVLFGGLAFVLRKPMGEFFAGRRNNIVTGLQRAQEAQASAQSRMDEIEQRLTHLAED